jgi:hypothetical protein
LRRQVKNTRNHPINPIRKTHLNIAEKEPKKHSQQLEKLREKATIKEDEEAAEIDKDDGKRNWLP